MIPTASSSFSLKARRDLNSLVRHARETIKREAMPYGRVLERPTLYCTERTMSPFFAYIAEGEDKESMCRAQEEAVITMTRNMIEYIRGETRISPYTAVFPDFQFHSPTERKNSLSFFTESVTISCYVYLYWQTSIDVVQEIQARLEQLVQKETAILDYMDEMVESLTPCS